MISEVALQIEGVTMSYKYGQIADLYPKRKRGTLS
jgi:hypothetical protein